VRPAVRRQRNGIPVSAGRVLACRRAGVQQPGTRFNVVFLNAFLLLFFAVVRCECSCSETEPAWLMRCFERMQQCSWLSNPAACSPAVCSPPVWAAGRFVGNAWLAAQLAAAGEFSGSAARVGYFFSESLSEEMYRFPTPGAVLLSHHLIFDFLPLSGMFMLLPCYEQTFSS